MKRNFLFLQGVCSPFFAQLADGLGREGHRVFKVNFNGGDVAYWGRRPAINFRDQLPVLPEFLTDLYQRYQITDQIVFGDCRPVHQPAIALARTQSIRNHVFEEGYFRPYWITLEREGANAHSLLPHDPEWFRRAAASLPEVGAGAAFKSPFWKRAAHDVAYHAAGVCNPLFFPHYTTHAPTPAPEEYKAYARRFHRLRRCAKADSTRVSTLKQSDFYLLPLQLDSDVQIRIHSKFSNMQQVMEHVFASFARCAPQTARLVVKNHPLDAGLIDYAAIVMALAERFEVSDRVDYLESGDLYTLLRHARGVITVNSTVGTAALTLACPIMALGDPIYKMQGLTWQGSLDEFWPEPQKPDAELFRCFKKTVIHATQVNGGFYSREGIRMATQNCSNRLTAAPSLLESLL